MEKKPKRNPLRWLAALVIVLFIVAAWLGWQWNWIRERHAYVKNPPSGVTVTIDETKGVAAPWSLRLFGETGVKLIYGGEHIPAGKEWWVAAKRMFPEARVVRGP